MRLRGLSVLLDMEGVETRMNQLQLAHVLMCFNIILNLLYNEKDLFSFLSLRRNIA